MKGLASIEPKNMDTETLEAFAAEGWAEFVAVRGVGIFGTIVFLGYSLSSLIIDGTISKDDFALNFGLAVACGFIYGSYFRYMVNRELRRRRSRPPA